MHTTSNDIATTTTPVTVIGLGLMGRALAEAFLANGHPTTVWNRTAGRADELVASGATRADGVAEAVRASPLVIICVRDYDAVREILEPIAGDLPDRVVVNLTSGSSQEARELAGWMAGHGAAYLDGAIMMTPPAIGKPETVILYGGPTDVYERYEPTLKVLGGGTIHLGPDHGMASLYDVALLGMMWSTVNGFLHALALVGTEQVTATAFLPYATAWLSGVASFLPGLAREVDDGAFLATEATLETQLPPATHLVHESQARGVDDALPRYTKALIEQAIADGHALDSYSRIIDQLRPTR